jgi:hypothetical protein
MLYFNTICKRGSLCVYAFPTKNPRVEISCAFFLETKVVPIDVDKVEILIPWFDELEFRDLLEQSKTVYYEEKFTKRLDVHWEDHDDQLLMEIFDAWEFSSRYRMHEVSTLCLVFAGNLVRRRPALFTVMALRRLKHFLYMPEY